MMLVTLIIVSLISIAVMTHVCGSYVVFFQNRQLNLAETRQRLFEVRDKLFDLGVRRVIPFDTQAHDRIRAMVNCSIRFAHDLSGLRLLLGFVLRPRGQSTKSMESFEKRFFVGLEGDSLEAAKDILRETHYWLMLHVIKGSVFLTFLSLVKFVFHLVFGKKLEEDRPFANRNSVPVAVRAEQEASKKYQYVQAEAFTDSLSDGEYLEAGQDPIDTSDGDEQRRLRAWLQSCVLPTVEETPFFRPIEEEAIQECYLEAA